MDIQKLVDRAKELIMDPTAAWGKIKGETFTVEEIYKSYLIPLALAGAAAMFVSVSVIGSVPLVSGLISALFGAALSLAGVYIAAVVLEWLAPKFACTPTRIDCFKFVGFASIILGVANLLVLLPAVLGILWWLLILYGAYVGFVGFQPLTSVNADKKWPLFIVYLLCLIVIWFVLSLPVALLMGAFMFIG